METAMVYIVLCNLRRDDGKNVMTYCEVVTDAAKRNRKSSSKHQNQGYYETQVVT